MGMGLVLLVALGVAGFLLARTLGWLDMLRTLGNPSRSRFQRSDSAGQTVFRITPARPSLAALVAIIGGIVWLNAGDSIGVLSWFGALPLVMGAMAFPIGARHRRPATVTVANGVLQSADRSVALADVADISVRRGTWINADEPAPVVHRTADGGQHLASKSTSAMLSRVLNRRMIERSHVVSVRTRAGSNEWVVSGGLTLDCAEALRRDLQEAVSAA